MAGEAYPKRWPAGFVDNDTSKYADAQFLNNAEAALLRLLGADPIDQGVQVWDAALGRMKSIKLTNSQIDPAAAIDKSKLAALNIVDADISGAAGIAKSKLNLNGAITNADIQAAAAILGSKLQFSAGTSPPGSPASGDLWLYQDVANSIFWLFRYNAAETTYKWEFVGGTDLYARVATDETTTTTTTWLDLATVGPKVTLPRAGDYDAWGGANTYASVAIAVSFDITQNATNGILSDHDVQLTGASSALTQFGSRRFVGMAASDDLRLRYYLFGPATAHWRGRWIRVRPIRVI